MRTKTKYRRIYEQHFGPIPKDDSGRTYDVHHIDGDSHNNEPSNLKAISLQEHYDIHYANGDYGAAFVIAKRMKLSPEEITVIAKLSTSSQLANGTHNFCRRGTESHKHNPTLYKFENIHTGEIVETTQYELRTKYSLNAHNLSILVRGGKRTYKGWKMFGKATSPEYVVHSFESVATGEVVRMTQDQFVKTYNANRGHTCQMIKKNPKNKTVKGWRIKI